MRAASDRAHLVNAVVACEETFVLEWHVRDKPMDILHLDDRLPLTCTRSGNCCHGHRIGVTPWEIAVLARELELSPAVCRHRYTDEGATRLRFSGPPNEQGKNACTFFTSQGGCSVHQARPLACRVYPLARKRDRERSAFTFAGGANPCLTRCPDVLNLPSQRLGDWIASQSIDHGIAAHDAYGDLVWGLLVTAASIAASGKVHVAPITSELERRIHLSGDERIPFLPPPWFDLLTIPELPIDLGDPAAFVGAHARRLQQAIANDFALPPSLTEITLLVMTMVIHLAPSVGIDQQSAVDAFGQQVGVYQAKIKQREQFVHGLV